MKNASENSRAEIMLSNVLLVELAIHLMRNRSYKLVLEIIFWISFTNVSRAINILLKYNTKSTLTIVLLSSALYKIIRDMLVIKSSNLKNLSKITSVRNANSQ